MSSSVPLHHFSAMYSATDVDGAASSFHQAIESSLLILNDSVGRVICKPGRPKHTGPCNSWYDDRCRAARKEWKEAIDNWGASSELTLVARHEYRRITRNIRREWSRDNDVKLASDLYSNPKSFWRYFSQSRKGSDMHGLYDWTDYFSKLFSPEVNSSNHISGLHSPEDIDVFSLFPDPSIASTSLSSHLNNKFTLHEVLTVLNDALAGKSAGVDGIPMEFFKHAVLVTDEGTKHETKIHVLAGHITYLFNKILIDGYPSSWSTNALTPVPKPKGCPEIKDDYRGIAVSSCIAKLYSMVLLHRLDKWAESNGHRANGQAGFRHERGTSDNSFVLNHIVEKYRTRSAPVYAAFIDFRKAYDSIVRPILWKSLLSLGLHGPILDTLMAMYERTDVRVRCDGQLGDSFLSLLGVKQGDPLSPLLFGLFIDRIEKYLSIKCPGKGVHLCGKLLQVLLYADDLVLLAESPADLQMLLDALYDFCRLNGMQVNIKKSDLLVFNPPTSFIKPPIYYNGVELNWQSSFIYLGMIFHESDGMAAAGERCLSKGRGALYALIRRCHAIDLHNVHLKVHLFDSLVKPILLYGCEVWFPSLLATHRCILDNPFLRELETMHKGFLKQCLGLRSSTSDSILMSELNRHPLSYNVLKQTLVFRNKIMDRTDDDLVKIAMVESISMAKEGKRCWVSHLSRYFPSFLDSEHIPISILDSILPDIHTNSSLPLSAFSVVRDRPDHERSGTKLHVYNSWFFNPNNDLTHKFWYNLHRPNQIFMLARFRMGAHRLNVESERWKFPVIPRSQRICQCCNLGVVEDELHLLYCPFYTDLRSQYNIHLRGLGQIDYSMRDIMNPCNYDGWLSLAGFLLACFKKRDSLIAKGLKFPSLISD